MEKFVKKENPKFNSWVKGEIQEEGGEFERVFKSFYDLELKGNQYLIDFIMNSYEEAQPEILTDDLWAELENSDSYYFKRDQWDLMSEKMDSYNRNWNVIREGYEKGSHMSMPIIARLPNNLLHLVSGNTRLSVARVKGIFPKVIIIDFPQENFLK